MEFSKPAKYLARVSDKYFLTENEIFLYVKFELINPSRITYYAGQYVSIMINNEGERRSYSIASTPDDNHGFNLLIETGGMGKGSTFFKQIKIGQEVEVLAPLGQFTIKESSNKLLFVATGSGIVPIYSMINDRLVNKHESRQMRLHWGMRNEADLFWIDNFGRLMENYPNFLFDIVLSKPDTDWDLCRGHVQDCISRDFVNGLSGWEGYVCGKPELVLDICSKLVDLGMKNENIRHEKFI
jgi:propane monooxygenase reductase subunit